MINLIVCRLNQLRSPFLAQYLSQIFPEEEFDSCGVSALVGSQSSSILFEVSRNFGFEFSPEKCIMFDPQEVARYSKILTVDKQTFDAVNRSLSISSLQNPEVVSLVDFVSFRELIPRDPFINEQLHVQLELAKLVSSYINFKFRSTLSNFITIIPRNERHVQKAHELATEISTIENVGLVDLNQMRRAKVKDIGNPNLDEILAQLGGYGDFSNFLCLAMSNQYIPIERVLLDFRFTKKMLDLSFQEGLVMVTPPLEVDRMPSTAAIALSIPSLRCEII